MYPQPNGDVLEYGDMRNPDSGKVERYVECWGELPADVGKGMERRGWVVVCDQEEVKGMIVRVGRFVQGLVVSDGVGGDGDEKEKEKEGRGEIGAAIGRWEYLGDGKGWERSVEIGELDIPRCLLKEGREVEMGEKVMGSDGLEWVCVEAFAWK